jgi:Flp pilus assembly protein TadD
MIICPILSQQRRADDGAVSWEHHECLREGCTFWAAEPEDCAIRASGLTILKNQARAEEAKTVEEPPREDPAAAALKEALERLEAIDLRVESLSERTGAATRDLGLKLLEGVSALEQPVNALRDEMDTIRSRMQEFAEMMAKTGSLIEEFQRREQEAARAAALAEARSCNARGAALHHAGQDEAAEAAFRRALELDPALAEAHNNLGIVLGRLGRSSEAMESFEKALSLKPDLASAMNNLGFLLHEGMEFERAADLFRKAALGGGDASCAWTNLGNALYRMERHADAVDAWKRAVACDPLNENAARALRMYEGAEAVS